jgi:hypothetical protein
MGREGVLFVHRESHRGFRRSRRPGIPLCKVFSHISGVDARRNPRWVAKVYYLYTESHIAGFDEADAPRCAKKKNGMPGRRAYRSTWLFCLLRISVCPYACLIIFSKKIPMRRLGFQPLGMPQSTFGYSFVEPYGIPETIFQGTWFGAYCFCR